MTRRKRGFTLTELIISIAIIGVLAAVLIPTIGGFIKKARLSADKQDVANVNRILEIESLEEGFQEPRTISELKKIISKHYTDFSFTPRSASSGYHFIYNTDTKRLELISEEDWASALGEFNLLAESTNRKPNIIEAFGWTKNTPYLLLDEGGSKLTELLDDIYQTVDLESINTLQANLDLLNEKNFKVELKELLKKQLDNIVIVYKDGEEERVIKNFANEGENLALIFSKNSHHQPVNIPDAAFVGLPLYAVDIPEGIKIIGASAFSDTGIKYLVVPGSIEKIKSGALNSDTTVEIVLNGDHDSEKLNEIFNEAGMLAKTGSTVKTAVGTYTVSVNEETSETSLVNSKAGKVIQSNLNPVNVNNFLNRIKNLNELEPVLILDKKTEFLKAYADYPNLATWEKDYIEKNQDMQTTRNLFFNNTYPLFESYFQAVNALYEALANEELVFANQAAPDIQVDIRNLLLKYEDEIDLNALLTIEKESDFADFISLGDELGTYYCDNPGIDYLILGFKGIDLTKRITVYSEGVYGVSISKSIPSTYANKENMARYGNQGSFPIVVGVDYVAKEGIYDAEELIDTFGINFELHTFIDASYQKISPNQQAVRAGSLQVNEQTGKHYFIVDLVINDNMQDHYKFVAKTSVAYQAEIYFVIVDAVNVETGKDIKDNSRNYNVTLTSNIVITTFGVDNEYWYDENGLLTYRSNGAFTTTTATDKQDGFTISGKTFYGNNYTIDGRGMDGPHNTDSSDKGFIILNNGAELNNLNVLMAQMPVYNPNGEGYTFSQSTAVLRVGGNATIRNSHIFGGLRGIRIVNQSGMTVNIIDSFFEGAMSNIEIYAGNSGPKETCYVNFENVSIRTANSAAVNSGGHGVAILWFPGSGGKGVENFDNINFKERNTKIYSWVTKEDAKQAMKGALSEAGLTLSDSRAEAIVQEAVFTLDGVEYLCTGMVVPIEAGLGKLNSKADLKIDTETFNVSSSEVSVTGGKVVGYYTKYLPNNQEFIDYITETWGTVDGLPWNGRLDGSSNLKPLQQANQYQHHGLYKTTEVSG